MCEHDGACSTCATCARVYCFECKEPGVVEAKGRLHADINALCHACRVKGPVLELPSFGIGWQFEGLRQRR